MASRYPKPSTPSSSGARPAKRALSFSSPNWKSPDSAKKGSWNKEDLSGYVVFFGEKVQGDKNKYHQMLFNIAFDVDVMVTVMDMSLSTDFKSKIGQGSKNSENPGLIR